jgi:hypothetical protein
MRLCELLNCGEIGWVGSVLVGQILVSQIFPLCQGLAGQLIGL